MNANGHATLAEPRCELCGNPATVTLLTDGTPLCNNCTPTASRADFRNLRSRARWFHRQWRASEALPLWWVLWRFAQVEYRIRRP